MVGEGVGVGALPIELLLREVCCGITASSAVVHPILLSDRRTRHFNGIVYLRKPKAGRASSWRVSKRKIAFDKVR